MIPVRDSLYQIRSWGPADGEPLVLLHGSRDTSITFQFMVDSLKHPWRVIAPDWRGHGGSESAERGGWFHDYLADLSIILDTLFPATPVNVLGHSLGGNLASSFAGLRPERVRQLIAIDAFGLMPSHPEAVVDILTKWLLGVSGQRTPQKLYTSFEQMAQALHKANHRLTMDKAAFLALKSSRRASPGTFAWAFDNGWRRSIPAFHSLDEWVACWSRIRAPALWIGAGDPMAGTVRADLNTLRRVLAHIGHQRTIFLSQTGHNLHHDSPHVLAAVIESFLTAPSDQKMRAAMKAAGDRIVPFPNE